MATPYTELPIRRITEQPRKINFPTTQKEYMSQLRQGYTNDEIFGLNRIRPTTEFFGSRIFRASLSTYEKLIVLIEPAALTDRQRALVRKKNATTLALAVKRGKDYSGVKRKFLVPVTEVVFEAETYS